MRQGAGLRPASRHALTGLLGGSFNPAHGGHRAVTMAAMRALGLSEVWWLVSPGNPLKDPAEMAPLAARLASARACAAHAPIRVTAIEGELGTRFTVDTLAALRRRYPRRRFIWLMGADNLAQLHRWRDWRRIAAMMPIAVIARPGYAGRAAVAPAYGWLRRYRRPAAALRGANHWRLPTLVMLPAHDVRSASAIRAAVADWAPDWANDPAGPACTAPRTLIDGVTRRRIPLSTEPATAP